MVGSQVGGGLLSQEDSNELLSQLEPSFVLDDKAKEIVRLRELIQELNFRLVMHTSSASQELRVNNELEEVNLQLVLARKQHSDVTTELADARLESEQATEKAAELQTALGDVEDERREEKQHFISQMNAMLKSVITKAEFSSISSASTYVDAITTVKDAFLAELRDREEDVPPVTPTKTTATQAEEMQVDTKDVTECGVQAVAVSSSCAVQAEEEVVEKPAVADTTVQTDTATAGTDVGTDAVTVVLDDAEVQTSQVVGDVPSEPAETTTTTDAVMEDADADSHQPGTGVTVDPHAATEDDTTTTAAVSSPNTDRLNTVIHKLTNAVQERENDIVSMSIKYADLEEAMSRARQVSEKRITSMLEEQAHYRELIERERALVRDYAAQLAEMSDARQAAVLESARPRPQPVTTADASKDAEAVDESVAPAPPPAPVRRAAPKAAAKSASAGTTTTTARGKRKAAASSSEPKTTTARKTRATRASKKVIDISNDDNDNGDVTMGTDVDSKPSPVAGVESDDDEDDVPARPAKRLRRTATDDSDATAVTAATCSTPTPTVRTSRNTAAAAAAPAASATTATAVPASAKKRATNRTPASAHKPVAATKSKAAKTISADRAVPDSLVQGERVVVLFSGFGSLDDPRYSNSEKARLSAIVTQLGGRVSGPSLRPDITHIVAPPQTRTMKTLGACLSQRWVMAPTWLADSAKAGSFLPEKSHGRRFAKSPFQNKKVFISTSFKNEHRDQAQRLQACKNLVKEFGGGDICRKATDADFALVGAESEIGKYSTTKAQAVTWEGFLKCIPGALDDEEAEEIASPSNKGAAGRVAVTPGSAESKGSVTGRGKNVHVKFAATADAEPARRRPRTRLSQN